MKAEPEIKYKVKVFDTVIRGGRVASWSVSSFLTMYDATTFAVRTITEKHERSAEIARHMMYVRKSYEAAKLGARSVRDLALGFGNVHG
jgi:hypothetical protein